MSFTTTTPYMSLVLPEPTLEPGPAWAVEINAAFSAVDSHDHSTGQGVPVPIGAVLINGDIDANGTNNIINLRSSRYTNQSVPLSLPTDIGSIYVSGGNLYYNNLLGQQVQITAGAALNAGSIGGIGGDYTTSGAAVYYTSGTSSYSFTSMGNVYSNMFQGATTIYPTGTNTFGITLQASGSLAASYTLTLPVAIASVPFSIIQSDASGNLSYTVPDNSTIESSSGVLRVKTGGLTVTQSQIRPVGTPAPLNGFAISSSSGIFSTNASAVIVSLTITTRGGPVILSVQADGTGNQAYVGATAGSGGTATGTFQFLRDAGQISQTQISGRVGTSVSIDQFLAPGSLNFIDTGATAGTHTYDLQATAISGSTVAQYVVITAYEI